MKKYSLSALVAAGLLAGAATSASAADLGGNCCADLEERIAELEATTVRKGNRKVSLTITGWVGEQITFWDDGHEKNAYVTGLGQTLSTNFKFTGSAKITSDVSAGYLLHIEARAPEQGLDAQSRLRHRMQPAALLAPPGQGDIDAPGRELLLHGRAFEHAAARLQRLLHLPLGLVDALTRGGTIRRRHVFQRFQLLGEHALLAEPAHPHLIERSQVGRRGDFSECLFHGGPLRRALL